MKSIRWADHAVKNLAEREIDRSEAELTLANPELVVPDPPAREVYCVDTMVTFSSRRC